MKSLKKKRCWTCTVQPSGYNPEIRNRIRIAVAAYAYEVLADPIMSDAEFDELAGKIDPRIQTGSAKHDLFFRSHFAAHTGSWVHKHPDTAGLHRLYSHHYAQRPETLSPDELAEIEDLI